jgi:hypothetical protein
VRATLAALQALQTAEAIGLNRGRSTEEMSRLSRRGPKPAEAAVAEAPVAEPEPEPVA